MKNKSRTELVNHLKIQIKIQIKIFKKQIVDTHKVPTKKRVHQLRITTRRIRALLWLAEHGSPNILFERLKSDLRKLGRILGQLRELDVAIQDARKYQIKRKKIKKKRHVIQKVLLKQINTKHQEKMENHLNKMLAKTKKHQNQTITSGIVLLQKKISPWAHKSLKNADDFHRLRIITKKVRYILEVMEKPIQPLRHLQDTLGKGHDLEVLQKFSKGNSQLQDSKKRQYQKALKIMRPTLHYALKQLSTAAS